jgi:hypothetical protein
MFERNLFLHRKVSVPLAVIPRFAAVGGSRSVRAEICESFCHREAGIVLGIGFVGCARMGKLTDQFFRVSALRESVLNVSPVSF